MHTSLECGPTPRFVSSHFLRFGTASYLGLEDSLDLPDHDAVRTRAVITLNGKRRPIPLHWVFFWPFSVCRIWGCLYHLPGPVSPHPFPPQLVFQSIRTRHESSRSSGRVSPAIKVGLAVRHEEVLGHRQLFALPTPPCYFGPLLFSIPLVSLRSQ